MPVVKLTCHLSDHRRAHVGRRLRSNLMAWPTTVRPEGPPDAVPVWFLLQDDETILIYGQRSRTKLGNIATSPSVALGLDVSDLGRDIIRIAGTARHDPTFPPADRVPAYVAKYTERIGAKFGTASRFAEEFSEAVLVTPLRLYA